MIIKEITEGKRELMSLLLLADEQENMVEKYLGRGTMFVLYDGGIKAECVVTDEGDGILELKNIAVQPGNQKKGYGAQMIKFVEQKFRGSFRILRVGTGDSLLTVPFYEKCGFIESCRVKGFFTDNYDHPIVEGGVLLTDMVYFEKPLQ